MKYAFTSVWEKVEAPSIAVRCAHALHYCQQEAVRMRFAQLRTTLNLAALLVVAATVACAQGFESPRFEAGIHFSGVKTRDALGGGLGVVGGRFGYSLRPGVVLEGEIGYAPHLLDGPYGDVAMFTGLKVGKRFDQFGVFGKLRPGVLHCGRAASCSPGEASTNFFALDLGVVLEGYPSRRTYLRVDWGDTVIAFRNAQFHTGSGTSRPGTAHNVGISVGFGFRF